MHREKDKGMTILEVIMAIMILIIGVMFIFSGNKVIFHYKAQHELSQQMFFYASGLVEAELEGVTITETIAGVNYEDDVAIDTQPVKDFEDQLEIVTVTVSSSTYPDIDPVVIKTVRLKP